MSSLRDARTRFVAVIVILLILDLGAVTFLFSSSGQGRAAWQERRDQLQQTLREKRKEAAPLTDIESRLRRSQHDAAVFMETRFPGVQSQVANVLTKTAADEKVQIARVNYKEEDTDLPNVSALGMDLTVTGNYEHVVKFINDLERQKLLFVIDSVALSGQEHGTVRLSLTLQTFLRRRTG